MAKVFSFLFVFILLAGTVFSQEKILKFSHITVEDGLPQNTINGIVKDKYGFMWFGTWGGVCRYDGYQFKVYKNQEGNPKSVNNNRVHLLYKDLSENIWVLAYDSTILCRYNYETDDFTRFHRSMVEKNIADSLSRPLNFSHSNASSEFYRWKVSFDRLSLTQTNLRTGKQLVYLSDLLDQWAISDKEFTDIYLDDQKILWVGTVNGGVNKADTWAKPFSYYCRSMETGNSIIDNNTRSICEDRQGILWVGSRTKGITKINRSDNTYTYIQHNKKNTNSLISNQIRRIYEDRYGFMWFGTKEGLDRYDPRLKRFYHYSEQSRNKIPNNWVYVVFEDYWGNLWIGMGDGLAKYNRETDKFLVYTSSQLNLKSCFVRALIEDKKHNLWAAIEGRGIVRFKREPAPRFEEKLEVLHHYQHSDEDTSSICNNVVYSLLEDENGKIWAGTNNGLSRLDPGTGKFINFSLQHGLPDITVMGLLADRKGNIWISHKKGLTRINATTFAMKNYSRQDGIQGLEFSEDAYFCSPVTGEMFFGGIHGMNSFFPDSIKDDTLFLPKVVLTDLKIQNQSVPVNEVFHGRIVLSKPIYLTKEVTILHSDVGFSIEFSGLHYANPQGNKYKYRLTGFDKDWILTGASQRYAKYSGLAPGTYQFKVLASNSDGYWATTPAELNVIVLAPWWQTWWFRSLSLLSFLLFIALVFYLRVAFYRKRQQALSLLVQQRTAELEKSNELLLKEQIIIEEQKETLKLANENLVEQQTRLEEYAEEVRSQNEELLIINEQLMEQRDQIEAQSEELKVRSENLKEVNGLLIEKQKLIQLQADKLEESNQQLAVLNSTKDRFFSIIAHDLRNPFQAVSGLSELLQEKYEIMPPEKIKRYLILISKSSDEGNSLLDNLLQWSRAQTGTIRFDPVGFSLADIVDENFSLLEGLLQRKNITVKSSVDSQLKVVADLNMVKTILRNLISNAAKFTRENGSITVEANTDGAMVEISVTDTGVGISDKHLALLFKIDQNITTKGTDNESGTGLGLILCKEFAERHGGRIWVESKLNKGSSFKFTLPQA